MMIPDDDHARLTRAKAYPFAPPGESYLFRGGRVLPLPSGDIARAVAGRIPVLASGSNASPAQLARKYAAQGEDVVIPVTRADVGDFDSVYNAHIAAYGSVPATLFPSPGTVLATFITWLDDDQLAVMHATEQPGVNYHYAELSGIDVEVRGAGRLGSAFAYISVAGCLLRDGAPVALAEVPARGRIFPALHQPEILAHVRDVLAPAADLDAFILESVADAVAREARGRSLAARARAFDHPGFRKIPVRSGPVRSQATSR
ncbi:MAG: hypothetical protein RL477_493 [Pseudomonadota bacterium]|jgi:hypothetical protein